MSKIDHHVADRLARFTPRVSSPPHRQFRGVRRSHPRKQICQMQE